MAARWLVNAETVASSALIVGQSTFAPDSAHLLHRHDRVEEFFFILEGNGAQLVEGGEIPIAAGDVIFVPRNEWHGFRNTGRQPVRAVFGYFGANKVEAGGYEVHMTAPSAPDSAQPGPS
jgi:mannose-6-phosphate isomerase-like protein (cupin superfamily)